MESLYLLNMYLCKLCTDQIKAVRTCVLTGKLIDKYCKTRLDIISAFCQYYLHLLLAIAAPPSFFVFFFFF